MDTAVARVVYASISRIRDSVFEEMEHIRDAALRHNVPQGVHSALLYQSGWFVHWKEGPGAAVDELMERVARDRRHSNMAMVHLSRGPRLLDGPWSMALVQCEDTPSQMAERVVALRRQMRRGVQDAPPAVWRKLSTPMRHVAALADGHGDAFHRVLVCSASGFVSFQLVQWLAAEHQAEVVHRRFAGSEGADVGSDYVDFHAGRHLFRVVCVARKALEVPLVRAFFGDYSHIVLLLAGHADRDLALLQNVAAACAAAPLRPVVIGVGPDAAVHAAADRVARLAGLRYLACEADSDAVVPAWMKVQDQMLACPCRA